MNKSTDMRFIKQVKNSMNNTLQFDTKELKELAENRARDVLDITPPEAFGRIQDKLDAVAVSFDFDKSPWCYEDWQRDTFVTLVASQNCAQMIRIPLECVDDVIESLKAYKEVLVNLDKDVKAAFDAIDEARKSCVEARG